MGGETRGHLPLEKVTYASVGPPQRDCHSRVATAQFAQRWSPPRVSGIRIHVSLRLDLPGLGRDLLGRAT